MKKLNYIYKNEEGEHFKSIEHNGQLVLSNPSYPFHFLFEVLEPLTEIGKAEDFEHLIKQQDYQFYDGETLTLNVNEEGNLVKAEE